MHGISYAFCVVIFYCGIVGISVVSSKGLVAYDCPPSCRCTQTVIRCQNGSLPNTDIFLQITQEFFPELDTLVVTGNHFQKLEADLFGPNARHDKLTKLNLSHNAIVDIHSNAFQGISNVEELDLSFNNISKVQSNLFRYMPNLKVLRLVNAFDSDELNSTDLAAVLHKLFMSSHTSFPHLQSLYLDGNDFVVLPRELLCKMPALEHLSLRDNQLPTFQSNASCLTSLRSLDLSENEFEYVRDDLIQLIDSALHLEHVNFTENTFSCDCYLKNFVDWFVKSERVVDKDSTTCMYSEPSDYAGVPLTRVNSDGLKCVSTGSNYLHTVYIFVALAVVALCLLMACLIYSNRAAVCKMSKDIGSGKATFRVSSGYEPLGREPEVKAEFV